MESGETIWSASIQRRTVQSLRFHPGGRVCIIYLMARRLTTELLFKRLPWTLRFRRFATVVGQKFTSALFDELSPPSAPNRGAFVFTSRHCAPFFLLPLSLSFSWTWAENQLQSFTSYLYYHFISLYIIASLLIYTITFHFIIIVTPIYIIVIDDTKEKAIIEDSIRTRRRARDKLDI